jgi:hypothetical protein
VEEEEEEEEHESRLALKGSAYYTPMIVSQCWTRGLF